jgi:NAD-dependent SIR2 family protein deacetylase
MARKLRIFISSTMKDLANERQAVVERLLQFNFEPVNAESWNPTGGKSWNRIEQELKSSDLFLFLLGERYGWIPKTGPKSGSGLSVPHLELEMAQDLGLLILPFLKHLNYDDTDHLSEDAKKRDALREKVKDWENGFFIKEFNLALDLASKVSESIITVLSTEYLKARITKRSAGVTKSYLVLARENQPLYVRPKPVIPKEVVQAIIAKQAVLFAGSGISLAAGLPSVQVFSQRLIQLVREHNPEYEVNPTGSTFSGIATDLEAVYGRKYLIDAVLSIIYPPQVVEPTPGHLYATKLFSHIFTTNYDNLFEDAIHRQGLQAAVVCREQENPGFPTSAIVKLHGSAHDPTSLLLTEYDILTFDRTRPRLWQSIIEIFKNKILIVVGTSLRDPSIIRLFTEVGSQLSGVFVAPSLWEWTPKRLSTWNLQCIQSDADTFMNELWQQVITYKQ